MACVLEGDLYTRARFERFFIGPYLKKGKGPFGISLGVQRHDPAVSVTKPLLALPLRLHLLDMGAVQQHDSQQVPSRRGGVDLPAKPLLHHPGQQAGMVDMGMGNQKKIYLVGLIDIRIPVAPFDVRIALMHAAIHGKAMTIGFHDKA